MWVFPPGERAFLGSLTSIPSQAAAVLHCTITARSRERLARASNMFKASKAVGFSEGSLACVASVSVGLGSKERPKNGILPARNWGESQNLSSLFSRGSLPLNPMETLATQAKGSLSLYSNAFLYNLTFCKLVNIHFVTVTVTIFENYVCVISLIKLRSTAFHC